MNQLFYARRETVLPKFKLYDKNTLKTNDVLLEPNHTHFIFVDDGSEGHFGKEIEFRSKLEDELRKGRVLINFQFNQTEIYENSNEVCEFKDKIDCKIPMVLIVVHGDWNTLLEGMFILLFLIILINLTLKYIINYLFYFFLS